MYNIFVVSAAVGLKNGRRHLERKKWLLFDWNLVNWIRWKADTHTGKVYASAKCPGMRNIAEKRALTTQTTWLSDWIIATSFFYSLLFRSQKSSVFMCVYVILAISTRTAYQYMWATCIQKTTEFPTFSILNFIDSVIRISFVRVYKILLLC